jgi:uncharacterized membrane protein YdjX (TVP38/TMEM64 family)
MSDSSLLALQHSVMEEIRIEDDGSIEQFVEEDELVITRQQWILGIVGVVILLVCAFLAYHFNAIALFNQYFEWVSRNKALGMLVQIGLITFLAVFSLPGLSIMYLGGGFLFQPLYVSVLVNFTGIFLGVSIGMLVGRYMLFCWVSDKIRRIRKLFLIKVVIQDSSAMTFLLRLALPLPAGTYVFAVMDCDWKAYWAGTLICIVLRVFPECFLGSALSDILAITQNLPNQDNRPKFTVLLITIVVQIVIIVCVGLWCEAALELVENGKMKCRMCWKQLNSKRRRYMAAMIALSLVAVIAGPIAIWTLDRFKPTSS